MVGCVFVILITVDLFDDEGFSLSDINKTVTGSEAYSDDVLLYLLESEDAEACLDKLECRHLSDSISGVMDLALTKVIIIMYLNGNNFSRIEGPLGIATTADFEVNKNPDLHRSNHAC